jgi:hypothetical protein
MPVGMERQASERKFDRNGFTCPNVTAIDVLELPPLLMTRRRNGHSNFLA